MPILRYFIFVGASLVVVMLALNASLPKSWNPNLATEDSDAASFDRTAIRIAGTEKKMEPVVIDTNLPTIVPPPAIVQAKVEPKNQNIETRVSDARAEAPIESPKVEPADAPKKKKKVARRRVHQPVLPAYQTPHVAGLFSGW